MSQTRKPPKRRQEQQQKDESRFHFSKSKPASVRARYLDYLQQDVTQRLTASIHAARFLDIGVDEKINATVPWHYKALEGEQQFSNFDLAFKHFQGRVLLLGAPGSGKTTTLLNLCLKLIDEARRNDENDIPLLFNLSEFGNVSNRRISQQLNWLRKRSDLREENPARVFERWLVDMLANMPVEGLNRQVAEQWVNGGQVGLLLDGLDEVTDEYLLKLAEIINQTYFREHPLQTVVVCSRIIEYQPLQEDREARLRLNGAVVLQPPTPQQIDEYLEAAQALALRDALRGDNALYEMAQTPLTLSMMTLAYGGQAPTDIPQDLPFIERRRILLDTYVERMVQRTARREKGIQFDLNHDNDVPPRYPLSKINHYLGWLAIRLSERARTLFPLDRFYNFLSQEPQEVQLRFVAMKYGAAMIAAWIIAVLTNAGLLLPQGWDPFWALLVIPLVAPLTVGLIGLAVLSRRSTLSGIVAIVGLTPTILIVIGSFLGLMHHALAALLGFRVHPVVVSLLFFPLFLLALAPSEPSWATSELFPGERPSFLRIPPRFVQSLLVLVAGAAIGLVAGGALKHVVYGIAVAGLFTTFWILRATEFDDSKLRNYFGAFVMVSALIIAILTGLGWLFGSRELFWLAIAVTILLGIASSSRMWIGTSLTLAVAVVVAHWIGGPSIAVMAVAAVALLHRFVLRDPAARLNEFILVNPALKLVLAVCRNTCLRYRAFLDYATASMLLKRAGAEYEFVHRLLRDHFAIRELVPKLYKAEGEQRIAIIQRISYQGESSFDALAGLINNPDKHVRSAAIEGLGRVAIPKVVPIMREQIANDPDEEVRSTVVQSLGKLSSADRESILSTAVQDPSPRVRRAVIKAWPTEESLSRALHDDSEMVFQEALVKYGERAPWTIQNVRLNETMASRLRAAILSDDETVCIGAARIVAAIRRSLPDSAVAENSFFLDSLLPALLTTSRHRNTSMRAAVISAISTIAKQGGLSSEQQNEVKTVLLEALRERREKVRAYAIPGLAALQLPDTRAALINALSRGNNMKFEIIRAFGSVRDKLAVPALLKYLRSRKLRSEVASALGEIGDTSIVPELLNMLEDSRLQLAAILTLGGLAAEDAVPKLRELFRRAPQKRQLFSFRTPEDVRPYAAWALGKIGDPSALPDLIELSPHAPPYLLTSQISALRCFPRWRYEESLVQTLEKLPDHDLRSLLTQIESIGDVMEPPSSLRPSRVIADLITSPNWEFHWSAWKGLPEAAFFPGDPLTVSRTRTWRSEINFPIE